MFLHNILLFGEAHNKGPRADLREPSWAGPQVELGCSVQLSYIDQNW